MQKRKFILFFIIISILAIPVFITWAWNLPSGNPPSGNMPSPIDTSSTAQTKTGNLTIDGVFRVGRYSSAPTGATGSLYFDTVANKLKVYDNAGWTDISGGGSGLIGSGASGQVSFWTSTSTLSGDNALFWDNTNKRLGIGTSSPGEPLTINQSADEKGIGLYGYDDVATSYLKFNINSSGHSYIQSSPGKTFFFLGGGALDFKSASGYDIYFNYSGEGNANFFAGSPSGKNQLVRVYGYDTSADTQKYGLLNVDTTGDFNIEAQSGEVIRFRTGGNDRATIDNSGNVGIGTTTPASLLTLGSGGQFQVNSSGDIVKLKNLTYSWPSAHTTNGYLKNDGSGNLSWTTVAGTIGGSGAANYIPKFTDATTLATSTIYELSGKVGIGTLTPNAKLEVNGGDIYIWNNGNNPRFLIGDSAAGGDYGGFRWDSANDVVQIGTDTGGYPLNLAENGNVGIGTLTPGAKLDVENINAGVNEDLRLSYKNEVNSGGKISWWAQDVAETANITHNLTESGGANGYLAFSTYNGGGTGLTEKLRITGIGNVGISTTTPSAKLHINNVSNDASLRITGTGYVDMPVATNLSNSNIYNDLVLLIPAIGHINSTRGQIGYFSRTDDSSGNTASYANDTGWWSRYDTSNNYPRMQKSLVGRGVWVENTRKNLFQYSSFEDGGSISGWTNSGLETFTTTSSYRKDATYAASLADTNASGGQAYRPHTLTNGQTYPFYCYAMNLTSGAQRQTVDSSVVQLWAGADIATTYESQGDGWYKISGTVTGTGAAVNYGVDVKANKAIALDACQIEADASNNGVPYATTYIYNDSTNQRKRGEESWYYRAWRGAWDTVGSAYNIEPTLGTISFWFRPEWATNAQNQDAYLLEIPNAIRVFFQASDDKIYAQMYNGSNWTTVSVASTSQTWDANTDHFFSFRWDSSSGTTLNIDGVETSYSGSWTPQVAAITYDSYFYIGSKSTAGNRLDALISNLAVFRRSLNAQEVAQIYYLKGPIWDINRSDLVTLQQSYTGYQRGNIRISGEFSGGTVSVSTLNTTYADILYGGLINSANYSSHIIFHLPFQNGLNGSRKEIGTFSRPDTADGVATQWSESSMKLTNVNANTPRIDRGLIGNSYNYDSSRRPANYAVYVEESRKNVAGYSSFEDGNPPTGWTAQAGCSAASATKAIHGSKSANLTSTSACRYYQTMNFTGAAVKHQITAYVWRNETNYWGGAIDSSIVSLYAATDLSSGALSTTYTPLSNGWYYLKAEFTATAANWNVGIYLPSTGRNVYVDAIQVERAADNSAAYFPTSYIPTTDSNPVTRAAETLSYPLPASFKSEKGGFQLWFKPNWTRAISGDNTDKYIIYIPNVMRVRLDATNDRWAVEQYNGSTWVLTANTTSDISPYIWNHLTCGWYYNYNYCRLNGGAFSSGAGWTPQDPSGQTIYIGSDPAGQYQINAEIAAFTLFDSYLDTSFQYQMYLNRGNFNDFFRTDQVFLSDANSSAYQEGSLGLSGVFRSGLGSASAPAFSFLQAIQTGMFAPASSSLAFTIGGNEALRINSSGNVGIGTTTPAVNLQINNTGASTRLRVDADSDKSSMVELASNGTPVWHIERYPTDNSFRIVESGTSTRLTVLPGGNLGIGTTTPASLLTIGAGGQFQVNSSGDIVKLKNLTYSWPSSHTANGYLKNDGSGNLVWETVAGGSNHNLLSATHLDTVTASPVLGDLIYANSTPNWTKLTGNITTTKKFLTQTGNGSVSAAPTWDTLLASDLPSHSHSAADITAGTLSVSRGGTGATTLASNGVLLGNGTSAISAVTAPTGTYKVLSTLNGTTIGWNALDASHIPNLDASKITSGNLGVARMPTGGNWDISSNLTVETDALTVDFTNKRIGIGTTTPASLLTIGAGGQFQVNSSGDIVKIKSLTYSWPSSHTANGYLRNDGSGNLSWETVSSGGTEHNLLSATHLDTLTGSPVLGDLIYANSTPNWTKLTGNITTTKKFLTQTGNGSVSAAPTWDTLLASDLPSHSHSASDITAGTLSVSRGGTGAATFAANGILYGNGTSAIQVTAAGTNNYLLYSNNGTPSWTNAPTISGANITSLNASNISSGTLALARGGTNATTFTASELIRMNSGGTALESSGKTVPAGDIVGTSDTQTLTNKTLSTGSLWNGGTIGVGYGGTGATTLASNGVLLGNGTSAISAVTAPTGTYKVLSTLNGTTIGWNALDASHIPNLDASKITSGNLGVARMPTGGNWDISSDLTIESSTLFVGQASGSYAGNVGIGTTTPAVSLVVNKSGATSRIRINADSGRSAMLELASNGTTVWHLEKYTDNTFRIVESGANARLTIAQGGNVGIGGPTNPSYALQVTGSINATSSLCINGDCKTSWPTGGGGLPQGSVILGMSPDDSNLIAAGCNYTGQTITTDQMMILYVYQCY